MMLRQRLIALWMVLLLLSSGVMVNCGDESTGTIGGNTLAQCQGKPDSDGDGVCDELENTIGTNPNNPNTDSPLDPFPDGSDFAPTGGLSNVSGGGNNGWILPASLMLISVGAKLMENMSFGSNNGGTGGGTSSGGGGGGGGGTPTPPPTVPAGLNTAQLQQLIAEGKAKVETDFANSKAQFIYVANGSDNSYNWLFIRFIKGHINGKYNFEFTSVESLKLPEVGAYPAQGTQGNSPVIFGNLAQSTLNYVLKPVVDNHRLNFSNSHIADVFTAVKNGNTSALVQYSGFFIHYVEANEFMALDHKAYGYEALPNNNYFWTIPGNDSMMQFLVAPLDQNLPHPADLPGSFYPSGGAAANMSPSHLCSLDLGIGKHMDRCLMFTSSASSPNFAGLWARSTQNSFASSKSAPNSLPWEGIWKRVSVP